MTTGAIRIEDSRAIRCRHFLRRAARRRAGAAGCAIAATAAGTRR